MNLKKITGLLIVISALPMGLAAIVVCATVVLLPIGLMMLSLVTTYGAMGINLIQGKPLYYIDKNLIKKRLRQEKKFLLRESKKEQKIS